MDNKTILWIVIGVAVLLVVIGIIYAVSRNSSDNDEGRRLQGRRPGTPRGTRTEQSLDERSDLDSTRRSGTQDRGQVRRDATAEGDGTRNRDVTRDEREAAAEDEQARRRRLRRNPDSRD